MFPLESLTVLIPMFLGDRLWVQWNPGPWTLSVGRLAWGFSPLLQGNVNRVLGISQARPSRIRDVTTAEQTSFMLSIGFVVKLFQCLAELATS